MTALQCSAAMGGRPKRCLNERSYVPPMSSDLSISATVVAGVFVWEQSGRPQPLPLIDQSGTLSTAGWSAPLMGLLGRAMIGSVMLVCLGGSVGLIHFGRSETSTPLAAAIDLDPMTTASVPLPLRPAFGE